MDLICQDVHFGLGEKKILKGVSLKVEGHQFHTILGPNGSGKTSLLKLLYRQERADKGLISLDGKLLEHWSLKSNTNCTFCRLPENLESMKTSLDKIKNLENSHKKVYHISIR